MDVTPALSSYTAGIKPSTHVTPNGEKHNIGILQLRAKNETSVLHEKRFCSENWDYMPTHQCRFVERVPKLTVTYVPELGDESWYTMTGEHDLNDRSTLKVNAFNGNVFVKNTDIDVNSVGMNLTLERFYNSQTLPGQESTLGHGWSLSLGPDVYLEKGDEYRYYWHKAGGAVYGPFVRKNDNSSASAYREFFKPFGGVGGRLEDKTNQSENAFVLSMNQSQKKYFFSAVDATGNLYLTKVEDRSGNTITVAYEPNSHVMDSITDTAGRTYEVTYNTAKDRVTAISESTPGLSSPRSWSYGYNGQNDLASFQDAEQRDHRLRLHQRLHPDRGRLRTAVPARRDQGSPQR